MGCANSQPVRDSPPRGCVVKPQPAPSTLAPNAGQSGGQSRAEPATRTALRTSHDWLLALESGSPHRHSQSGSLFLHPVTGRPLGLQQATPHSEPDRVRAKAMRIKLKTDFRIASESQPDATYGGLDAHVFQQQLSMAHTRRQSSRSPDSAAPSRLLQSNKVAPSPSSSSSPSPAALAAMNALRVSAASPTHGLASETDVCLNSSPSLDSMLSSGDGATPGVGRPQLASFPSVKIDDAGDVPLAMTFSHQQSGSMSASTLAAADSSRSRPASRGRVAVHARKPSGSMIVTGSVEA